MADRPVVYAVMDAAGLDDPHGLPKGVRHGFGVAARRDILLFFAGQRDTRRSAARWVPAQNSNFRMGS